MKGIGSVLVAAAMVVGSFAAMGCNKPQSTSDDGQVAGQEAVAPEETPESAPSTEKVAKETQDGTPGFEQDWYGVRYSARVAPPALRVEVPGRAPSDRHFWAPGYWRWSGRQYTWVGGRWSLRRDGYNYYGPRWYNNHNRWDYRPGRWYRR